MRLFRFSIRTLAVGVTVLCIWFAMIGARYRAQLVSLQALERTNGTVELFFQNRLRKDAVAVTRDPALAVRWCPVWLPTPIEARLKVLIVQVERADFSSVRDLSGLRDVTYFYAFGCRNIDDDKVAEILKMPALHSVALGPSDITDAGVALLAQRPNMRVIDLEGSMGITDRSVESLITLHELIFVNVRHTKISRAGIERLIRELPNCKVAYDGDGDGG